MNQEFSQIDLQHTKRALELAALGIGQVSPNPLVGCVIVAENGEVVGEGAYFYDDIIHAEAVAIKQAGERAKGGTAYVSLEPHDYEHRTPPCTLALINAGIRRVVCPIEDPNPLVSGKGFARLGEYGVEVEVGLLAENAAKLNEKFIIWHQKQRPFVHLKLAMSLDAKISLGKSVSTALTGKKSLQKVHELRHEYDAILVGGNTAFIDNPSLTDRSGKKRRRKLVRVILDNRLQVSENSTLVKTAGETPTLVFSNSNNSEKIKLLESNGVEVENTNSRNLNEVLENLRQRNLQSVLVEGGTEIAAAFIENKFLDKISFFYAPIIIGGNDAPLAIGGKGVDTLAKALRLSDFEIITHDNDFELTGYPRF
ncbi:MAG: bifunctional diaminohydroxyphosphoribosylaminopyrimidine deaminase/5-amino-6-(5-phosphoribosylamino)uracil reductase RibD [Pyrinomonadaceae bacterium]|nr:bifunctional diaminohydroxyphosphoribosylaminopyrimidine deaminase/5-amino-6-(5-phosphoribosylamino)uracil reductase RibD [Pyrinomonadaceae bacterium]